MTIESAPRPHYEPRNVTVRRELFRFAESHGMTLSGDHHTHRAGILEEVWKWTFSGPSIPASELMNLLFSLYPSRIITFSAHINADGMEILLVTIPALPDQRER